MVYPNLKAEMARQGYTGSDIAKALGIHVSGAYLLLSGKRSLPIRKAMQIRNELFPGMTLDYLFDPAGDGEREAKQ